MANGIYTALSGVMTNMQQIEVISHNIANISTPAFKMERMASQAVSPPTNNNGELTFSMPEIPVADFTQGPMVSTGNPLDVALTEGVYLEVNDKGQTAYVRSSTLTVMPDGTLVDSMGHQVMGDQNVIKIPLDAKQLIIGTNGDVTADGSRIDRLRLVSFENEKALKMGGDQSFIDQGGAKPNPTGAAAPVMPGYREQANFTAVKQMTDMITAHRTYDITMNAIRTINQIDRKAATGLTTGH
jgi:flagellar basal-body rod protein FlgF